ncbi:PRC-barrel domain-containing protein [Sphingomonas sp.]|uniref:PRC-barrel domain-containing protein n=1 Tax=Sphingomonas sp. TaxID=28214 RepID=UPI003B3B211C
MLALAGWIAPAATMIAAIMTAANLGTRVTGWGFVVFSIGAVAWVIVGFGTDQQNLLLSNAFLLIVDVVGVWRWLGRKARYDAGASAATARSAATASPTLFALTKIEGMPVRDAKGEVIATAVDAMAACDGGGISYIVVSEGGVGGVGERLHALGWGEVTMREDGITTRLSREALVGRPELGADAWPATAAAAGIA